MPWDRIQWHNYGKHVVHGNPSVSSIIASTRNGGIAKYKPGLPIEALELSIFTEAGRFIYESRSVRVFYLIEPNVIGWDNGQETRIVRVEWGASPPGPVHGRPICETGFLDELRRWNRAEFKRYKEQRKHTREGGSLMKFVNWSEILPRYWGADVVFSYLTYPADIDSISSNPVGIRMPGGMLIDVEWDRNRKTYVVSLINESQIPVVTHKILCKDTNGVIAAVKRLGEIARSKFLLHNRELSLTCSDTPMPASASSRRAVGFVAENTQQPSYFVIVVPAAGSSVRRVRSEAGAANA